MPPRLPNVAAKDLVRALGPAAVLISLEDFASYEETAHLLKSPRNAERLRAAIDDLDAGRGIERKLSE